MAPALRLHLVTLGVDDVARATRFYEALGLRRRMKEAEGVAFFDAGGAVISLYGRDALAKDSDAGELPRGSGSAALAFNVTSESAVEETLDAAATAGGIYRLFRRSRRARLGSRAQCRLQIRRARTARPAGLTGSNS
jgi:uncharacterized protein